MNRVTHHPSQSSEAIPTTVGHRALKLFTYFAGSAFFLGALGYLALSLVMPREIIFGALFRMFLYHESHPFQYIAVVAFHYGIIATVVVLRWPFLVGWRRSFVIVGMMVAAILFASVAGGILWKIHDMQAGFFTTGTRFWMDLLWGAEKGVSLGWLIIALSFPYNILGLIIGYFVTRSGFKISAKMN